MLTKKDYDIAYDDARDSHWQLSQVDRELEKLTLKRQKLHHAHMQNLDRIRFLKEEAIEPLQDSEDSVTLKLA